MNYNDEVNRKSTSFSLDDLEDIRQRPDTFLTSHRDEGLLNTLKCVTNAFQNLQKLSSTCAIDRIYTKHAAYLQL